MIDGARSDVLEAGPRCDDRYRSVVDRLLCGQPCMLQNKGGLPAAGGSLIAGTYESLLWSEIGVIRGSKYGAATAATQISVNQNVQRRVRSLDILDRRRLRESSVALGFPGVVKRRILNSVPDANHAADLQYQARCSLKDGEGPKRAINSFTTLPDPSYCCWGWSQTSGGHDGGRA